MDLCALNKITKKDAYPLPHIDDLYQNLRGVNYFTSLDLCSGYWQIHLANDACLKTAFTCHSSHYQFCVMPFGLCNTPATFQMMMNDILWDYLHKFVMVYLDDVIIYSPDAQSHFTHVDLILKALCCHALILNAKKCSWAHHQLLYLGHIVSAASIHPDPGKVQAILTWLIPHTVMALCGFICLAAYFCKFIPAFAKVIGPLYDLLCGSPSKCTPVSWSSACNCAFTIRKKVPV